MSADFPRDVVERLAGTLARPAAERGEAVEGLCRDFPHHADAIRRGLAAVREAGLDRNGAEDDESIPERLGRFRLIERLGGGTMGVVYLAEDESLGREVAVKLVRPEYLYFSRARDRFHREIEAVASLQHPGIVPVYSAGLEGHLPYYVMERVQGCTLAEVMTGLASRAPSSLTARELAATVARLARGADADGAPPALRGTWTDACVEVTRQVAEALAHAHARGVLHRDVKPSNIMITASGRAMLVDFGLARTDWQGDVTRTGYQPGSLAYMSPEQLEPHEGVDHRADVYALGVTLYEMLTLRRPFDAGTSEATRRRILEPRPCHASAVNPAVAWDLDTVCAVAMERDRRRRYGDAADFARDLVRLQQRRPIAARRPGHLLRLRRLTQRHPTATVAALLSLVLAGTGTWWWHDGRQSRAAATSQEERAAREARAADGAVDLVVETVRLTDPELGKGAALRPRDVLDHATAGLDRVEKPDRRASLLAAIGWGYHRLGHDDEASQTLRRAIELYRRIPGEEKRVTAELVRLGVVEEQRGRLDEAASHEREALDRARHLCGEDCTAAMASLHNLASILGSMGETEDALALTRDVLRRRQALLGDDHRATLATLYNLGTILHRSGDIEDARELYERALAGWTRLAGRRTVKAAGMMCGLGELLHDLGEHAAAERLLRESAEIQGELLGNDHYGRARALSHLGIVLFRGLGDPAGAEPCYVEALEIARKTLGEEHAEYARHLNNLAGLRLAQGRLDEAEAMYRDALRITRARLGATHPIVASRLNNLACALMQEGQLGEAEPLLREALELSRTRSDADPRWTAGVLESLAGAARRRGRYDEALRLLDEERELLIATYGAEHWRVARVLYRTGVARCQKGERGEGERLLGQALALQRRIFATDHQHLADTLVCLGLAHLELGRPAGGRPLLREAWEMRRRIHGDDHAAAASAASCLGACETALGRYDEAERLLRGALHTLEEALGAKDFKTRTARRRLRDLERCRGAKGPGSP